MIYELNEGTLDTNDSKVIFDGLWISTRANAFSNMLITDAQHGRMIDQPPIPFTCCTTTWQSL